MQPERASSWNGLEGVRSVDQTGEPMGWRSLERDEGVWQLRSGEEELFVSRGSTIAGGREEWWLTVTRDGEPVVDDHRVRVGADGDLGEALAAVLTALE